MKLTEPANSNYAAVVVKVKTLVKLENSDRLQGIPLYGNQAIVDLSTQVGDIGLFLPAEVQLSEEYCRENNLFRHANLNRDPEHVGYLEDNRRVRAIKLRGNRSDALFMPISSLAYLGVTEADFKEGDTFDKIGEAEICRKYVVQRRGGTGTQQQRKVKESRVDPRIFPEHSETRQFLRVQETLNPNALCVVTQKLHGSSVRVGNIPVKRTLSLREKIAKKFGVRIQDSEYAYIFGSRKVIKDATNPDQAHYYDEDIWTAAGKKLIGLVPENYIIYGELIGWTESGAPIQKSYTYQIPQGQSRLFIYRVAVVNNHGVLVDLSWDAVKEFCAGIGVPHVPELFRTHVSELTYVHSPGPSLLDEHMDVKYRDTYPQALPLDDHAPCDEGICIRIEGIQPTIVKAKSPLFLGHETRMMDEDVVDLESEDVTL